MASGIAPIHAPTPLKVRRLMPVVCTDTDGDGVEDGADQCPSTPTGDPVNSDGCTDTDGDGIADGADNCPLIANSNQANADGDSVGDVCDDDDDGDGIADVTDQCPNTPQGAQVNASGCTDMTVMAWDV